MRVRCRAVRWWAHIEPGVVEAYLTDCDGFEWQVVAKHVYFDEWAELGPGTTFPLDVSLPCELEDPVGSSGDCVRITVESLRDGSFEVRRSSLIDDPT